MSKHHQRTREHSTNRMGTSTSVGPETRNQIQEQMGSTEAPVKSDFVPDYEDIQRRAYLIHEEKGGSDLENWLEAERILRAEHHD